MALFGLGSSAPQPAPAASGFIYDAGTQDFEEKIIKASMDKPVLVDFWAPWCGPCKQLMPVLEQAVRDAAGAVILAKVNIDDNQQLAGMLQIQSVPTVMAFFQGQPITAFSGAQPASQIKKLIDQLIHMAKQTAPEALNIPEALKGAALALSEGDAISAQNIYVQILQQDEKNVDAYCGLVRTFIAVGEFEHAQEVINNAPEEIARHPNFAAAKTALEMAQNAPGGEEMATLSAALEKKPGDHQVRFDLAQAQFAAGQKEAAIDNLIEIIARDRAWNDDGARKELLKFFDALGPADPLSAQGRKKLSRVLFS
jgi:putative thioredoxin